MAPSVATAVAVAPSTTTGTAETGGARRRSLSGASALLARRFTRQSSAPRPTASRSESSTRRRATIASSNAASTTVTTHLTQEQLDDIKVHVRIVPNIENPSRSLIFDIVDRELNVGSMIRIGRYSERHANLNCMSFKSKVVSRCHCEVWVETDGKLYIRDTKSSSGTFLNHVRLSPAGNESRPVELSDGDIVQLGVDFQGGREEMYRSVKMRFELNRSSRPRPLSFNLNAFQNLRNLTQNHNNSNTTSSPSPPPLPSSNSSSDDNSPNDIPTPPSQNTDQEGDQNSQTTNDITTSIHVPHQNTCSTTYNTIATATSPASTENHNHHNDLDECCICLYALAPFQALFVSPCSHTYHFKCIRPLLQSYPGFQCPICRTYSDLEASVAIETDEVMEKYNQTNDNRNVIMNDTNAPPADSGLSLQSNPLSSAAAATQQMSGEEEPILNSNDDTQPLSSTMDTSNEAIQEESTHNIPSTPLHVSDPYSTTFVSSPVIYSEIIPDSSTSPLDDHPTTNLPTSNDSSHVIVDSSVTNNGSMIIVEDTGITSNTDNDDDDDDDEEEEEVMNRRHQQQEQSRPRERRTSHIMDKIKMVFFEKRKSVSTTGSNNHKNRKSNPNNNSNNGRSSRQQQQQRPLSYPNLIDHIETTNEQGSSGGNDSYNTTATVPLDQTLSRQSTAHLQEIDEEISGGHNSNNRVVIRNTCLQAMVVDG